MLVELAVILILILANGVFAAAEIAIVSLRRSRLRQRVQERRRGATALVELRSRPERFLATVQVGITVVGTTAAAVGGADLAEHLEPLLRDVPVLADIADELALGIVVVALSYLSLVLGELVPKSLALRNGEGYALLLARPLQLLSRLAAPVVWVLTASSNLLLRPFSDRTDFMESRVSKAELQQLVEEATEVGEIDEEAGELASRALAFDQLTLGEVMIPRGRIDTISLRTTREEQRQAVLGARRSLAIAVDEHGAVSGMVTFEDLVEERPLDLDLRDELRRGRPELIEVVDPDQSRAELDEG